MPEYLYRALEIPESGPIKFVASTGGVKRDGRDLDPARWRLDNFRANPVAMWVHGLGGNLLPIGRADVAIEDGRLVAEITFDQGDPFAQQVERKYRDGFLHAVSVGWRDIREGKDVYYDLTDVSAVPIPADPAALKIAARADMVAWARDILSEEDPPTVTDVGIWEGVATAMVACLSPDTAIEDTERRGLYNVLERAYRRLGRTAPEWVARDQLTALGPAEWGGLFLEGEMGMRAGAVLNARNKQNLREAARLIKEVLDGAGAADDDEPPEGDENQEREAETLGRLLDILNK